MRKEEKYKNFQQKERKEEFHNTERDIINKKLLFHLGSVTIAVPALTTIR
jgi:hypothetical protein